MCGPGHSTLLGSPIRPTLVRGQLDMITLSAWKHRNCDNLVYLKHRLLTLPADSHYRRFIFTLN